MGPVMGLVMAVLEACGWECHAERRRRMEEEEEGEQCHDRQSQCLYENFSNSQKNLRCLLILSSAICETTLRLSGNLDFPWCHLRQAGLMMGVKGVLDRVSRRSHYNMPVHYRRCLLESTTGDRHAVLL